MKPRTLLILFLVVAALGAFIALYERDLPSSEERSERAKKLLGGLETGAVTAVEIESPAGLVRLERVGAVPAEVAHGEEPPLAESPPAEWVLALPAELAGVRADRFAVERLLDQMVGLDKVRTFEDPDRAGLGLEQPLHRITFEAAGGETTVEIGSEVPGSSSVLVGLVGRSEAWVVSGVPTGDLGKVSGEWRDREVFPLHRDDVDRLSLSLAGAEAVVLSRRGESFWIDQPVVDRADTEAVESLLSDLVALRAVRFVDRPAAEADLGLEPPRAVIEANADAGESLRIEIGGPESPGATEAGPTPYFARVGGQVVVASAPLLDRLSRGVEAWQSRALSERRLYQIDRVRIVESGSEPAGEMLLRREGADWRRGDEEIPYSPVSDLLFAVTDARAERLESRAIASARADLTSPRLTLTFEGGDEPEAETVTLYSATAEDETPAWVTGRDFVLWLAPSTVETLTDSIHRLRETEPIPEDEAAVDAGLDVLVEEGDGGA